KPILQNVYVIRRTLKGLFQTWEFRISVRILLRPAFVHVPLFYIPLIIKRKSFAGGNFLVPSKTLKLQIQVESFVVGRYSHSVGIPGESGAQYFPVVLRSYPSIWCALGAADVFISNITRFCRIVLYGIVCDILLIDKKSFRFISIVRKQRLSDK